MIDTRPHIPIRKRALLASHSLIQAFGLSGIYCALHKPTGATILMFHSVAEDADAAWIDPRNRIGPMTFRHHIAFLASHRRVISIDELASALREGRTVPQGSVVITIDDGYRDTLTVAAPILAERGLPATIYLATGYVSREENQWIDQLYSAFSTRTRQRLRLAGEEDWRDIREPKACGTAYRSVAGKLLEASHEGRQSILDRLNDELAPEGRPPRLTLSWDEVRELRRSYPLIGIGGHTRDHIDLSSIAPDAASLEIAACALDVKNALGESPRHFSFPYNRTGIGLEKALEGSGFDTAATSGPNVLIGPGTSRYALPRIEAPESGTRLGFYTSGAYPALSVALAGRR